MDDKEIVDLYWARDEAAITETDNKYGNMLISVSRRLVPTYEDAKECVNDTYFKAWNRMPTDRPEFLGAYLTKIIRALSVDRFRSETADKRGGISTASSELSELIPSDFSIGRHIDSELLKHTINGFLKDLNTKNRVIFVKRYFLCESIDQISRETGHGTSQIKTALCRMREKLSQILEKEGLL